VVSGQTQVITLAEPWVIAYDIGSGTEIWRLDCLGPDVAPAPVVVGDLLVIVSPHNHVSGLRLDGKGDVTATHQVWQHDEFVPDITSPLSDGERLYLLLTFGDMVCLDGATGAKIWDQFMEGEYNASPTLVGNRIYVVSAEGQMVVIEAAATYQELARSELGEAVRASPAVVDGRIYLRATENLYCLGDRPAVTLTSP
jgi:outer membrane protein assembly factor BamB